MNQSCRMPFAALLLLMGAAGAQAAAADNSEAIRSRLRQSFPGTPIEEVRPSRIPGMYEVFVEDSVAFADATGERLFVGQVLDTNTRRDIGAQIMDERNRIDIATLPLERAIKTVRGNGSRKLVVFADPDCPFCHELEKSLAPIGDITIYTFLYPLADLHPGAPAKALAIWCTADRAKAWSDWMLHDKLPAAGTCAPTDLEHVGDLGRKLKIRSTPMLYFADGSRVNGALSRENLEKMLAAPEQVTRNP